MTPREAIRALPTWAKVASIVASIALAGMVFGRDWASLPAQTQANAAKNIEQDRRLDGLERGDSLILVEIRYNNCLLTLPEEVRVRLPRDPLLTRTACQ